MKPPTKPITRATPRSEVGRHLTVVPLNERRDGLHHTLPGARWALRGSAEVGPIPVVDTPRPGVVATSAGASGRAARTAAVSGPCATGRNLARLLKRRRKSSDAVISPPALSGTAPLSAEATYAATLRGSANSPASGRQTGTIAKLPGRQPVTMAPSDLGEARAGATTETLLTGCMALEPGRTS